MLTIINKNLIVLNSELYKRKSLDKSSGKLLIESVFFLWDWQHLNDINVIYSLHEANCSLDDLE